MGAAREIPTNAPGVRKPNNNKPHQKIGSRRKYNKYSYEMKHRTHDT